MKMLIKQRCMVVLNSVEIEFKIKAFNKTKGYVILEKGNNS